MIATIPLVLSGLRLLVENAPSFYALGIDFFDVFSKGKALITSDTASTPAERAAGLAEIEDMEARRDARLEELRLTAPNS